MREGVGELVARGYISTNLGEEGGGVGLISFAFSVFFLFLLFSFAFVNCGYAFQDCMILQTLDSAVCHLNEFGWICS